MVHPTLDTVSGAKRAWPQARLREMFVLSAIVLQSRILPLEFSLAVWLLTPIDLLCVAMFVPFMSREVSTPVLSTERLQADVTKNMVCTGGRRRAPDRSRIWRQTGVGVEARARGARETSFAAIGRAARF
jgi:hypothetical protein